MTNVRGLIKYAIEFMVVGDLFLPVSVYSVKAWAIGHDSVCVNAQDLPFHPVPNPRTKPQVTTEPPK
jgi:hypothetical protein